MSVALSDLLKTLTKDDVLSTLLGFLKLVGFQVTAWQPGSVGRHLIEKFSELGADWTAIVRDTAAGGFLEIAKKDWLTKYAASAYGLTRNNAVFAQGSIVFTDTGGAPLTWSAGQLIAESTTGKRFVNTTGGTLNAGSTLTLSFKAESPGSAYNVSNGTITRLVTPIAGVTLSNPAISGTDVWFTTSGTDVESDDSLRERCRTQWGALGSGANRDAYIYWARKGSTEVTRVHVQEHYPTDGKVGVFVAGASGVLPTSAVTAVSTYVQARRPLCVTVAVTNATALAVALVGAITYRSTVALATVQAAVAEAVLTLSKTKSLGGGYVYRSEIIAAIKNVDGVINVSLTTPAADVALGLSEVPSFGNTTSAFTWTATS